MYLVIEYAKDHSTILNIKQLPSFIVEPSIKENSERMKSGFIKIQEKPVPTYVKLVDIK